MILGALIGVLVGAVVSYDRLTNDLL